MAQSSYANRILLKIFKYVPIDLKPRIIKCLYGNIIKLLSNSVSFSIYFILLLLSIFFFLISYQFFFFQYSYKLVEIAYISANQEEKSAMCQEFYGDLYKIQKDFSISCLQDIINTSSYMKPAVLSSTKSNICRLLNK